MLKRSGWATVLAAFFFAINFSQSAVKPLFFSRLIYFLFLGSLFLFLRKFKLARILKPTVGGISFIVFAYGLLQKFFLFPYYLKQLTAGQNFYSQAFITRIESGRIFSIFTLPTLYAIVCAVLILFIFHYLLKSKSGTVKFFWAFLLAIGLANLALSQSFGGILSLSVGILLYLILSGILDVKYVAPVVMVLALFLFLVIGLRFSEAKELAPLKLRLSNWHQALRMIESSPFLGAGLGNYESQISGFARPGEARSIYAHNFFLQFTTESGVIVTFFFLLVLFLFRKRLLTVGAREKVVYTAAFFILLFYNLIDIGFYFFSAGIAGAVCLSQIYPREKGRFKLNMAVLALLSLFLLWETISDTYQKRGDFWLSQNDHARAMENYQGSIGINPFNIRALLGCAAVYYSWEDFPRADACLDRVLTLHRDSADANYLKAIIHYRNKRYFSSLYHAYFASEKNKINPKYRRLYRKILYEKRIYESIKDKLQVEPGQSPD